MGNPYDIENDPIYQEELAKAYKEYGVGAPGNKPNAPGFTTGIKQGLGGFVSGVGQVAEDMGWKDNAVKRYGSEVQANNPSSAASQSWEGFKESPWQGIKEIAGQGVGSTLPSLAAFALPGGQAAGATGLARVGAVARGLPAQTALAAAPIYGSVREDQQRQGFDDIPSAAAAAIGGGIVESKLGIQRVLGQNTTKPLQEFVGQLASTPLKTAGKTWLRTGLEEGAEELVQQPMQQLGAHRNPLTEESLRDTAWSGFGGVIGGLAMGGLGGAKMGLAHKGVNDFRQRDLLNPSTSLDELDDQAKWNKAFVERDQGVDAGKAFYDQRQKEIDDYIESLVPQFREDQRKKVIDLLSNQKQADFDLEAPVEGNDVIGEGFNPYDLTGSVSRLTQVDPIQPDLFANIDNPFTGESDAVPQVAQGSNQVQGGNSVGSTGAVGLGNSATGQRDGLGRTAIAPAGPSGTTGAVESAGGGVGAVNPATAGFSKKQLAAWNDAVEKLGEGHPALESISDAIAKNKLPVAQKALTEALAPAKIESLSEIKLPKVQQKVFDYMLTAARENNLDAVVDSEGTFKSTEIAEALGLKKGSALAAITGAQKHLAAQLGFGSVAELKTFLKNRTAEVRSTQESDSAKLGMSPTAQNNQVVNDADLFGNPEAGAEQNMGIINSVGGSQGETEGAMSGQEQLTRQADAARARGAELPSNDDLLALVRQADRTKNDIASDNVQTAEEVAREERIKAEAKSIADAQNKAVLATGEAKTAGLDWDDFKSNTAPNFSDLTEQAQASWVVQYVETVSNDSSNEAIESAQRDFERQLEPTDVRSETQGSQSGPTAELGRTSEGGQGTLSAPVQKAEPTVTTKKRRLAKPEEGVTKFSEGKTDQGIEPQKLAATLRKYFFSPEKFNKLVSIFPNAEAIPADVKAAAAADAHMSVNDVPWEEVQGFAMNGKVYLVASNIKEGNELGVFLHELGVHVGMERLIGKSNMSKLSSQIEQWAAKDDGSKESKLAKDAVRRAEGSASEDRQQEVIAYFVEEAVKAGINPVAVQKTNSPLAQWFRSLWAAAKLALRKIGFGRFDQLTAQNIVDLSYGAAKMELTGTWHGTAADFRNFNHSYMGSGEGAQAFGWGTYLAQRVGIAKGYWEADVKRKGSGRAFVDGQGNPVAVSWNGPTGAAFNALWQANGDYEAARASQTGFGSKPVLAKLDEFERQGIVIKQENVDGSLMRVDTAVHDDEMLDWDKPLSEQSEVVRDKLLSDPNLRYRIEKFGDYVEGWNGSLAYKLLEENLGSSKAASEYLDSIGIKGIKFLDSMSRGPSAAGGSATLNAVGLDSLAGPVDHYGKEKTIPTNAKLKTRGNTIYVQLQNGVLPDFVAIDTLSRDGMELLDDQGKLDALFAIKKFVPNQTRNLVIFNDKNIQRVASQVGANRDKVKFSQADITKTSPQYRQASTLVKQLIEYAGNKLQSLENNLMFGHQLGEKLQRLMPGTASYIKSVQNRQTERVKHEQEIARIANLYNELDTKQQNALNSFVQKSTMDGKWGFKPTWFEKDVQTEVDATAKTQFDALSPEAQQVAKDMFKFGSEQQKRFDESVNANIDDPKQKVQRNQMYGKPYAPLKRFGDHVVVGKSAQFLAEEKENPGGKRLEEMKADENHYYVEFTDGNLEAIQRRDKMAEANPNLAWESKPLQLEAKALNSVNFTVLEKLKKQIEASDNKSTEATKGALKSLANQLYIQQLNQLHANKSQAQRLNVKGADTDMMRAFVTQGRAEAALIANLRTHAETEAALQQIQKAAREGDNQDTKTRIANAVLRRHLAMLDFKPTPIQNKLMGLNSFYMLLTSPAYYLTNSTQPFVVTLPYMAGRFGGANSWNTLRDAYKTTLELVKLSTLFKDQNLDTTHLKKFDSVGRESEALQTLLDENLVNVGMEMELGDIANQSKNPTWKHVQKGMQVLKTGVANVEVLNRLSSAVAGYRLAYTEAVNNKLAPEDAHNAGVEYARKVIIDTHGDYAGYNAPTVMMQGAFGNLPVKLMTQFKKFQFIQAGLLIGTFRDAYMRGNLNNNEKAVARAMFKWMLGTQAALAGALGGVTGIPMAILGSMVAGAFGDDGEDKEAYLRRILGGGAFAQLILHGAPAAAGVDISKRVGMGAALDPFRMADPQTDWSDYALSIAGPSAGLASRFGSGMSYLGKGQYWKGLEMMMPSGVITNASKVARYESEGLTNSRGDVVMKPEEVSLMTDLMQSLGLETTQLSDRRWKAEAVYDRGVHFKEKTSQLQRDHVEAVKDQDQSALNEIRKGWMELQAERVKQGFKRENMSTLTHAPMAQKKRERDTVHGLQSTATNKKFVQSIDGL